jgi:hypothetical protein
LSTKARRTSQKKEESINLSKERLFAVRLFATFFLFDRALSKRRECELLFGKLCSITNGRALFFWIELYPKKLAREKKQAMSFFFLRVSLFSIFN